MEVPLIKGKTLKRKTLHPMKVLQQQKGRGRAAIFLIVMNIFYTVITSSTAQPGWILIVIVYSEVSRNQSNLILLRG